MVTLAELIAQSQAAFPSAFQAAAGPTGFSLLPAETQVAAAQVVSERAALTRSIFPTVTTGLTDFIKEQSKDIVNLFKLGVSTTQRAAETSVLSSALNEQITIREDQLAKTQEAIRNQELFTSEVNERLSRNVIELGQSLKDIGQGGFDPIKFFTDNPLIGGIGIGGLAVGAVVLLLLLRR